MQQTSYVTFDTTLLVNFYHQYFSENPLFTLLYATKQNFAA